MDGENYTQFDIHNNQALQDAIIRLQRELDGAPDIPSWGVAIIIFCIMIAISMLLNFILEYALIPFRYMHNCVTRCGRRRSQQLLQEDRPEAADAVETDVELSTRAPPNV
jgi:hypothetical protein